MCLARNSPACVRQAALCLLSHCLELLTHVRLMILPIPQVLVCRSAATSLVPHPAATQLLVPAYVQDHVFDITEFALLFF